METGEDGPTAQMFPAELPRQYLRACLLVLLAESPSHGYDLLEQVRRVGVRTIDAGGLYRELRAMDRASLTSSWWEASQAGPARRTYALTDVGRQACREAAESLERIHRLLGDLVARIENVVQGKGGRPS